MDTKNNFSAFEARLADLSMNPRTISFYTADYAHFLRYCSGHKQQLNGVTDQVLRNFFLWHEQDRASRSVLRRSYTALKKAYDLRFLPDAISFFQKPLDDLPVLHAVLKGIKVVLDEQLTQIVLAQLYVAGCDMSHLRSLTRRAIDLEAGKITVQRKEVPLVQEVQALLERHISLSKHDLEYLFVTKMNNQLSLLSQQAVWRLIRGLYPKSSDELAQLKQIIEDQAEHHLDSSFRDEYHNAHPRN